jgi:hypothetical protein
MRGYRIERVRIEITRIPDRRFPRLLPKRFIYQLLRECHPKAARENLPQQQRKLILIRALKD